MATETPSLLLRTFGLRRLRRQAAVRHRARRAAEILRHEGPLSLIARVAALAGYRRALRNAARSGYREIARFAVLVLGPLPGIRIPYVGRSRR